MKVGYYGVVDVIHTTILTFFLKRLGIGLNVFPGSWVLRGCGCNSYHNFDILIWPSNFRSVSYSFSILKRMMGECHVVEVVVDFQSLSAEL